MNALETAEVQKAYTRFEELSDEIIEAFAMLRVVQHIVQDIPQFDRGEKLPDVIKPTTQPFSLFQTLSACVKPQAVFQADKNLPKRHAGVVQFEATEREYQDIALLVERQSQLREFIVQEMLALEPNSRKRAALTKKLFPGILYQTLHRRVPLAPFDTTSVLLSWCTEQKSIKRLSKEQARAIVDGINATAPEWQAQKNLARFDEIENFFKVTNVRVHPQAVITFENDEGKADWITKKVHSPIIVLRNNTMPVRFNRLEPFEKDDTEHQWLKAYKPLVEGSSLVYKDQDLVN